MTIQPLSDERLAEIKAWLREPDYAEEFNLNDVADWMNRRPVADLLAILARLDKAEAERKIAMTAVMEVVDATRAYLPPAGITSKALVNLVLAATDNPTIYPLIVEFEALAPSPRNIDAEG